MDHVGDARLGCLLLARASHPFDLVADPAVELRELGGVKHARTPAHQLKRPAVFVDLSQAGRGLPVELRYAEVTSRLSGERIGC